MGNVFFKVIVKKANGNFYCIVENIHHDDTIKSFAFLMIYHCSLEEIYFYSNSKNPTHQFVEIERRERTLKQECSQGYPEAQCAFKDLMIH